MEAHGEGWVEGRLRDRASGHRRTFLGNMTHERSLELLREKCLDRVRKKRSQLLAALRRRNGKQSSRAGPAETFRAPGLKNETRESSNALFLSGSIRELVRRELSTASNSVLQRTQNASEGSASVSISARATAEYPLGECSDKTSTSHADANGLALAQSGAAGHSTVEAGYGPTTSSPPTPSSPTLNPYLSGSPFLSDVGVDDCVMSEGGLGIEAIDDCDWMIEMEEEIMRALEVEESSILADFYDSLESSHIQSESDAATDDLMREQQYQAHLQRFGGDESRMVLCPVCHSHYLFENQSVIFCQCGDMRVDSQGDCVGLSHLKEALGLAHESHGLRGCGAQKLLFSCTSMFGSSSHLQAECKMCGFLQVII